MRTKNIYLVIALFISTPCFLFAQENIIIKYFDSSLEKTPEDSAYYISKISKEGPLYKRKIYWASSNKLYSSSTCLDTSCKKQIGTYHSFFKNGQTKDSTYYISPEQKIYSYHFYESGQIADSILFREENLIDHAFHYYENGKLWIHHFYNKQTHTQITEAFNEDGSPIEHFIYDREAVFPGGDKEWIIHLQSSLRAGVPVRKGASKGVYQVIVRFIIDTDGTISKAEAETNYGFGMEKEVLRVINKAPKWVPAIYLNKAVKAYRRQPISFVVGD